jgi:glutathione synthase/RimK-type ligase-like ATP-grasp enzyme
VILLWGVPGDRPLAAVRRALAAAGRQVHLFDQRRVLDHSIELSVSDRATGRLVGPGATIDLGRVAAVYVRAYDPLDVPALHGVRAGTPSWRHAIDVHEALRAWAEVTEARVIHPTSAMASNGSKPYQVRLLRAAGFAAPATLVTSDPGAAREFVARHRDVVYKSASGVRSIVNTVDRDHLERLDSIAGCPTQFQAYVPGVDVRVHVVGDRVFACEIASAATDYRYPGEAEVDLRPVDLPDDVAGRCRAVTHRLGLRVSGIDLRRPPGGDWHAFEVNPSPAFSFYDLGGAIADAIADLLASGGPR